MNLLLSCPPVYNLPGTWSKCDHALIPHGEYAGLEPAAAMAVLVLMFLVVLTIWGLITAFGEPAKNLTDPWDDDDD
tara:strand:- start:136 stop:363 length:228 start_codon:yes stop_codon:yes gene_type:complete